MHQVATEHWNQLAESQPLATDWAKAIFPLPPEQMAKALDREETKLMKLVQDSSIVAALIKVGPLLWEHLAISKFLEAQPNLASAMPAIETINEAVETAALDYRLSSIQRKKLARLLRQPPA